MVTKKSQMERWEGRKEAREGGGVGRRNGEEAWEEGVRGLTDVNQVDLLSFLHELEGNLNVLSLLNREARVCLGSAAEWVKGEEGDKKESTVTVHTTIIKQIIKGSIFTSIPFKMYLTYTSREFLNEKSYFPVQSLIRVPLVWGQRWWLP